jgi:hypothetical protein
MGAHEKAFGVLVAAEEKLRAILVQAAAEGDYDHLAQIAGWAKLLNTVVLGEPEAERGPVQSPEARHAPSGNGVHTRADGESIAGRCSGTHKAQAGRGREPRKGQAAKQGYPQFVRDGESLVKIGWSKSERKPYEHKAPRGVLQALLQAVIRAGSGGKRFTVEALLPLLDTAAGTEIPGYQTYLTLAWLRSVGLVVQHGRQGYSLPEDTDLERESARRWNGLVTR